MFPDTPDVIRIRDRSIIQFCYNLGYSPARTLELVSKAYPDSHPARSTIYKCFALNKTGITSLSEAKRGYAVRDWDLIVDVEEFVIQNPSSSATHIAAIFHITKDTVKKILVEDLQLQKKWLRWIPHILTAPNKLKRCELAAEQLEILQKGKKDNFAHIITGDETWLPFETPQDYVWLPKDTAPPERPKQTIASEKVLVTVFWSTTSFYVINAMPVGESIDAVYFQKKILDPLLKEIMKDRSSGQYYIHFDNAPAHRASSTAEKLRGTGLIMMPHPPYSPDLAPSDFYLFGRVKERLKGMKAKSSLEAVGMLKTELDKITVKERIDVMLHWIERLERVIETKGEYFARRE
jgi:hypothetical protein